MHVCVTLAPFITESLLSRNSAPSKLGALLSCRRSRALRRKDVSARVLMLVSCTLLIVWRAGFSFIIWGCLSVGSTPMVDTIVWNRAAPFILVQFRIIAKWLDALSTTWAVVCRFDANALTSLLGISLTSGAIVLPFLRTR